MLGIVLVLLMVSVVIIIFIIGVIFDRVDNKREKTRAVKGRLLKDVTLTLYPSSVNLIGEIGLLIAVGMNSLKSRKQTQILQT